MKPKDMQAYYQELPREEAEVSILADLNKEIEELKGKLTLAERRIERHHKELFETCDHCEGTGSDPDAYMTTASCQNCNGLGEVPHQKWLERCNGGA